MNNDVIYVLFSFFFLPTVYFILSLHFRRYEHARTKNGTPLNVYLTYQATNTIAVTYLGIAGIIFYVYQESLNSSIVIPPLYLRSELLEKFLIYPMIFYQFHSLVLYWLAFIPELGNVSMALHHVVTLLLGLFSIYPQPYLQGYSVFYFGLVELSTVFLQGIDLYKNIRYTKLYNESLFQQFQIFFVISFISLRVVLWPMISVYFWRSSLLLLMNNHAHSKAIVIFSLGANLYLTFLQFYWGALIARKLYVFINNSDNNQIFLYNLRNPLGTYENRASKKRCVCVYIYTHTHKFNK